MLNRFLLNSLFPFFFFFPNSNHIIYILMINTNIISKITKNNNKYLRNLIIIFPYIRKIFFANDKSRSGVNTLKMDVVPNHYFFASFVIASKERLFQLETCSHVLP